MEDVVQALMMAFAVMVFVIAFSVAMYMFSQVTTTAETLALYTDSTLYYDNVRLDEDASITDEDIRTGKTRIVNAETIIPTLYRYPDEEFCVKIYNSANKLIQIFEGKEKLPDEVTLINRDWYSINQFNVIEIIPASIEKKGMYHIENCGFFKIKGVKGR